MKGRIADFSIDFATHKQRLSLTLDGDFRGDYDKYNGMELEITVKPYRAKRSLDANAYCWKLIGKLAKVLNLPDREIYRNAIKQVGVYRDVDIREDAANTLIHVWQERGIGWVTEKVDDNGEYIRLRLYYGSSCYNTKQMSRLIDNVVADCKELGIETMTPAELAGLIDNWDKQKRSEKDAEQHHNHGTADG